ncbi:MAG: 2-amino-4-hydroxy-6-hydroxymethyldihydropteridine diphosphokinase [Deltaproteobacteria bacterium]|nr:2-amino-4-hydroxy-6-hydroxymethyldihydropteridine diphosphokinase [Deltaproteobacteria bacterium]
MARAFISIGSNINPAENFKKAIRAISQKTDLKNISTVYETEPEGKQDQPVFYNSVIEIDSQSSPCDLKEMLRSIEAELGRKRNGDKYAPRTIDLDLIIYDDIIEHDLKIPDPEITLRPFLAIPLFELAPELILPGSNTSIKEAAQRFSSNHMKPLEDFTSQLKAQIYSIKKL